MRDVAILLLSLVLCTAAAAERPNIIFIMSDDHGWQAISAYGSRVNETPNIDRIGREGMRFDRATVTNGICGPSRAVILSGAHSHINGYLMNGNIFDGNQITFPKVLREHGYQTAIFGKWHLRSAPTGFDEWHVLRGQGPYYNPNMLHNGTGVSHTGYTTDIITDLALDWLEDGRDGGKPFMMMLHHKAPHRHWQPGPQEMHMYEDVEIPEPATLFDDWSGRTIASTLQTMTIAEHLSDNDLKLSPQKGLTDEQRVIWDRAYGPRNEAFRALGPTAEALVRWKYQRYVKDYLRCVAAVDRNVGRVLDWLDESGEADNTIIVYTSDQGWFLGEHGWYDKRWMYEESFRTPLLVRWPGHIAAGTSSDALVQNLDFAPTFLDIAGAPIPDRMQGKPMTEILTSPDGTAPAGWRDAVYYHYYESHGAHTVPKHDGVSMGRYKLMHFYELGEWELYDLATDPDEMTNVYDDPSYRAIRATLDKRLSELRREYGVESDPTRR